MGEYMGYHWFLTGSLTSCDQACQSRGTTCEPAAIALTRTWSGCSGLMTALGKTWHAGGVYGGASNACVFGDWGGTNIWVQIRGTPACDGQPTDDTLRAACSCKAVPPESFQKKDKVMAKTSKDTNA